MEKNPDLPYRFRDMEYTLPKNSHQRSELLRKLYPELQLLPPRPQPLYQVFHKYIQSETSNQSNITYRCKEQIFDLKNSVMKISWSPDSSRIGLFGSFHLRLYLL